MENVISIQDIREIYTNTGKKPKMKQTLALEKLKKKLDHILKHEDWEPHQVIEEHDYSSSSVLDCIIYYVTGFISFGY